MLNALRWWIYTHRPLILLIIILLVALIVGILAYYLLRKPKVTPAPETHVLDELIEENPEKTQQPQRTWHLSDLSPKEIRQIAACYQLKVSGRAGNTASRISFWIGCELFMLVALWILKNIFTAALLTTIGLDPSLVLDLLVIGTWSLLVIISTEKLFYVFVPKLGALVVMSFTGRMHVFKPGVSIRFPWEGVHYTENLLSQRTKKVTKKSAFLVDGIPFTFNWTAQWGPFLPLFPLNIRFEEGDVTEAVTDIVENTISEETLGCHEEDILTEAKVVEIQNGLLSALEGAPGKERHRDTFGNTMEARVGANVEISTLGPPELNADYQQARVVASTAKRMTEQAGEMAARLGIEGGVAMNLVMMLNREPDIKKTIIELEVSKSAGQLGEHIGRILVAGENIASRFPPAGKEK